MKQHEASGEIPVYAVLVLLQCLIPPLIQKKTYIRLNMYALHSCIAPVITKFRKELINSVDKVVAKH